MVRRWKGRELRFYRQNNFSQNMCCVFEAQRNEIETQSFVFV